MWVKGDGGLGDPWLLRREDSDLDVMGQWRDIKSSLLSTVILVCLREIQMEKGEQG